VEFLDRCIIRKALPSDLESIQKLEHECFPPLERASFEMVELRFNTFMENFIVCEYDGVVIGFINGCLTNETTLHDYLYHDIKYHNPNGSVFAMFGLDVDARYRRKGIARALMLTLIEDVKRRNLKGIILTCKDHLVEFYKSLGYKYLGVSNSSHGNAKWNDMELFF
jgi:ribosomal protein S18 acetylase RimI-like enzyme